MPFDTNDVGHLYELIAAFDSILHSNAMRGHVWWKSFVGWRNFSIRIVNTLAFSLDTSLFFTTLYRYTKKSVYYFIILNTICIVYICS